MRLPLPGNDQDDPGQTTEDLEYTLETVACIGCCALAPCVMIDDDVEAKLTPKRVAEIIDERNKG